jgi:hypothetical protein
MGRHSEGSRHDLDRKPLPRSPSGPGQDVGPGSHASVVSIPYDSISSKSKSPIPVTYLSNEARRSDSTSSSSTNSSFVPPTIISGPIPPLPPSRVNHGSPLPAALTPVASNASSYSPRTHSRGSRSIDHSRLSVYSTVDDDAMSIASHRTSKSFTNEFHLEKPKDDVIIEQMFLDLMVSRSL